MFTPSSSYSTTSLVPGIINWSILYSLVLFSNLFLAMLVFTSFQTLYLTSSTPSTLYQVTVSFLSSPSTTPTTTSIMAISTMGLVLTPLLHSDTQQGDPQNDCTTYIFL